jgi:hypothetical protein
MFPTTASQPLQEEHHPADASKDWAGADTDSWYGCKEQIANWLLSVPSATKLFLPDATSSIGRASRCTSINSARIALPRCFCSWRVRHLHRHLRQEQLTRRHSEAMVKNCAVGDADVGAGQAEWRQSHTPMAPCHPIPWQGSTDARAHTRPTHPGSNRSAPVPSARHPLPWAPASDALPRFQTSQCRINGEPHRQTSTAPLRVQGALLILPGVGTPPYPLLAPSHRGPLNSAAHFTSPPQQSLVVRTVCWG